MDARWMGDAPFPPGLSVVAGTLRVELAPGARLRDFAVAFEAAMQDLTFEHVARKSGQIARRHRSGRQLDVGARYAGDPSSPRIPIVVNDLYAFRPRSMRRLVGRAHQAATLVAVRSALRLASTSGNVRDA